MKTSRLPKHSEPANPCRGFNKGLSNQKRKKERKKAGVAILISDKIDFKIQITKRDNEGHCIMIKESIQEDRPIVNICAPNIGAPQYIRQMLTAIKEEIDSNTIILGNFNTPLSPMDRSSKLK